MGNTTNQPNQTNLQKINKKQQNIQGSIKETNRNICSLSQQQILSLQQGLQTLYSAHKLLHSLHQPPTTSANNRSNPASPTPTPTKHQTTTKTNRQTTTPPALPTTPAAKQPTLPPNTISPTGSPNTVLCPQTSTLPTPTSNNLG